MPCGDSVSRVQAEFTVDGEVRGLEFASLYFCVVWFLEQAGEGHSIVWPPKVSALDYPTAGSSEQVYVSLPLDGFHFDATAAIDPARSGRWEQYGPWVVETNQTVQGGCWPYYIVFSDLEAAGRAAADWNGWVWHWDGALRAIGEDYLALKAAASPADNSSSDSQDSYYYYVEPEPVAPPSILPGGDDDVG